MRARRSTLREDAASEDGYAAVTIAVALVSLIAASAFVVDVGRGMLVDRRAQAAADASALGAALALPNRAQAQASSESLAGRNFADGTVTLAITSTRTSDDTATASANASVGTVFAHILGIDLVHVGARAQARIGSYLGYANGIAPWVTDRSSLTFGTEIAFKVSPGDQATSGNFGSVRLPLVGKNCALGSGTNDYRSVIEREDASCLVQIGSALNTEPGNMGAVTGQALADRGTVSPFDAYSLLRTDETGKQQLTTLNHPNLVVIPIVESLGGGSSAVTVTGFAWFVITSYTKDTVRGIFVRSGLPSGAICPTAADPNAGCPTGAYDPDGFTLVELVG